MKANKCLSILLSLLLLLSLLPMGAATAQAADGKRKIVVNTSTKVERGEVVVATRDVEITEHNEVLAIPGERVELEFIPDDGFRFAYAKIGTLSTDLFSPSDDLKKMENDWFTMPDHDVEIWVKFEPIDPSSVFFNLEITPAEHGTVETPGGRTAFNQDELVQLNVTPEEGYELASLYRKDHYPSGALTYPMFETSFQMPDNHVTLIPTFRRAYYSINATAGKGGTVSGGGQIKPGYPVTLKALPDSGYDFDGWVENGKTVSKDTVYRFYASDDRDLKASFKLTPFSLIDVSVVSSDDSVTWTSILRYLVNEDVTISGRIEVKGTVNLVLCDGATLHAPKGIHVPEGNRLIIWGQEEDTGNLVIDGLGVDSNNRNNAGIGGNNRESSGEVTIHGGTVSVRSYDGAGIGGGFSGSGGKVTITGGTVSVQGQNAAGIGGGWNGSGGTVEIGGGTVTALSYDGAGIGGGWEGNGGDVTITGGTVTLSSRTGSAIGAGADSGDHGTLTLYDNARVTAGPGEKNAAPVDAAAREKACRENHWARIELCTDHGYVDGACRYCGASAALLYVNTDGHERTCDSFTAVTPETLRWTDGVWYAVTKNVTASDRIQVSGDVNLILCDGATLDAAAGIRLPENASLTVWAQDGGTGALKAAASGNNAGIGGDGSTKGTGGACGTLTVNGGMVTATGGGASQYGGAGVGGGGGGSGILNFGGPGGTVKVNGGTLIAAGGGSAMSIGSGKSRIDMNVTNGTLTVWGGAKVTAGDSADSASPVKASDRSNAGSKRYVRIEACTDHSYRAGTCEYCGASDAARLHLEGSGDSEDPFVIQDAADWEELARYINEGYPTDRLIFRQNGNVTASTMAGTKEHPFRGVYDGGGNTLAFEAEADGQYCAPFRYADGATIQNLKTTGNITTGYKFAAGLVGSAANSCHITNCVSEVEIVSTVDGDGTHGGFAATGNGVIFNGCAFTGSITGESTTLCAGFLGWDNGGSNCINCLFDGTIGTKSGTATFIRNNVAADNCYYTRPIGQGRDRGSLVYPITADDGIRLDFGKPAATYSVSGLKAYDAGIERGGKFYAGVGDTVTMTPAYPTQPGETACFTASGAALRKSGGEYTLTMPEGAVTVHMYTVKLDGDKLEYRSFLFPEGGGAALAAWYDAQGRMLDSQSETVTESGPHNHTFTVDNSAAQYKLFFLDGFSTPLCENWEG